LLSRAFGIEHSPPILIDGRGSYTRICGVGGRT
jgi:hypothetical protein